MYVTAAGNFTVRPSVFPVIPAEPGISKFVHGVRMTQSSCQ